MITEQIPQHQSLFKEHVPPPIDGDFDEVARIASEVLGVPFVYVSLKDFRSNDSSKQGQKGTTKPNITQIYTISMAPKAYVSDGFPLKDPNELKVALAKFKDLHFCATVPLLSSTGDRLGTLYTFDHTSKTWSDIHWEIMTAVGKIITHRTESQWDAYRNLVSNRGKKSNQNTIN